MQEISTCLMFEGRADEAMTLYLSLFSDSELLQIERYRAGEQGAEGSVMYARFRIGPQQFRCLDSPVSHDFGFTPSTSLFVDFDSEAEMERVYEALAEGGQLLMPIDDYGFSRRYAWLNDRFGVSWQLNLPHS